MLRVGIKRVLFELGLIGLVEQPLEFWLILPQKGLPKLNKKIIADMASGLGNGNTVVLGGCNRDPTDKAQACQACGQRRLDAGPGHAGNFQRRRFGLGVCSGLRLGFLNRSRFRCARGFCTRCRFLRF